MKVLLLGLLSSFFFAFTFVFNRLMEVSGGSWIWSASLRFIFMVPFLLLIVLLRKNLLALFIEMKRNLRAWFLWSFVGFVLFYAPLTFAAAYGPSWLTSSTWQFTIIAGTLLTPFFYTKVQTSNGIVKQRNKLPLKPLMISLLILIGILFIQFEQFNQIPLQMVLLGFFPVLFAAFAYPLGNRKMMEVCDGRLDTFQRVLGMTIASLPFWLILSIYGLFTVGPPDMMQIKNSFIVAICSGVIATLLFFFATDLARHSPTKLAGVEATLSGQIIFVILGEVLLLSSPLPSGLAITGILIIIIGMVLHSFASTNKKVSSKEKAAS